MITVNQIGQTIKIVQGTSTTEGILKSVRNTPEKISSLPANTPNIINQVWSPGNRIITVSVLVTAQIASIDLLNTVVGLSQYEIEGELYNIQSVQVTDSTSALITLQHSQGSAPLTQIQPPKLTIGLNATPVEIELVTGSSIQINNFNGAEPDTMSFSVYRRSASDIWLLNNTQNNSNTQWVASQLFEQDGELWEEKFTSPQLFFGEKIVTHELVGSLDDTVVTYIMKYGNGFISTVHSVIPYNRCAPTDTDTSDTLIGLKDNTTLGTLYTGECLPSIPCIYYISNLGHDWGNIAMFNLIYGKVSTSNSPDGTTFNITELRDYGTSKETLSLTYMSNGDNTTFHSGIIQELPSQQVTFFDLESTQSQTHNIEYVIEGHATTYKTTYTVPNDTYYIMTIPTEASFSNGNTYCLPEE